MKNYKKLLLFMLIALAAAALLSPWILALWTSVFAARGRHGVRFEQIFAGVFIAAAGALVLATSSLRRLDFLSEAGLGPRGRANILRGFLLAVGSMAALGAVMWLSGSLDPRISDPLHALLRASVKALLTALLVGFFEELFFRGMLFRGLLEEARPATAYIAANLFYAASHFIKPPEDFAPGGLDPSAGVRFLVENLQPFLNPPAIFPGLVGLFLIGLVLSYVLVRTRSLYLSIGLHAGWVFGIKTLPLYGDFNRADLGWVFGSKPKIVSGVVTWIGILFVGAAVHLMTRKNKS